MFAIAEKRLICACARNTDRCFSSNLSWGTNKESLEAAFSQFGTVTDAVRFPQQYLLPRFDRAYIDEMKKRERGN